MSRTWKPYGSGSILDRDEPGTGTAIRAYATLRDEESGDGVHSWEVTAESPFGAVTMAAGEADDLDDAKAAAAASMSAILGCPAVAS